MAETTQLKVSKDLTVTFADGTRSYTPRIDSGTITMTNGGYNIVRARATDGTFVGPPRQGEANVSTIEFDVAMFGAGADASDVSASDFAELAGLFSSTWTTTESGSDAAVKPFTCTIALAAAGGVAGASRVYSDCVVQPGSSVTPSRTGNRVKFTLESPNPYPAVTTVAP